MQIKIDFQNHFSQARTYHQLGIVAQEQRQWPQTEEHFLEALRIFTEYKETHNSAIVLRSLARLWQEAKATDLGKRVAVIIGVTPEETETLLQEIVKTSSEEQPGE